MRVVAVWTRVRARLGARLDDARRGAAVLRATGLAGEVRPTALPTFLGRALKAGSGPHLAVLWHAAAHPDKEAVVELGEPGAPTTRLTWRQLDEAINRAGNALLARGARDGAPIAIMLDNGIACLVAQLALARIGAVAVQIGYRLKAAEIAHILGNSQPVVTVLDAAYLPAMTAARAAAGLTSPILVVGADADADALPRWAAALATAAPTTPIRRLGGDAGGVIVYTSGTTGTPKGAARSWRQTGVQAVFDMMLQMGMTTEDRHLVVCPLYHSAAPAFVTMMLSLGATVVLMNRFEPEAALAAIAQERITSAMMVPTMLVRLCALPAEIARRHDTSSLRWLMSGAAPLATATARQVRERFGPVLWNFYGSTETGLVTLAGPADHTSRPGTIGRALAGNQLRLVDGAGLDVPLGAIGELYAHNGTLITGYHRDARATSAACLDGFLSVGDLARVDADGYYYLESRTHDMVISGGVNIYPREIEDALMTHPAILDAAVIGVPDAEWGETLAAFVVARPGVLLDEDAVIAHCRAALADYKRPRRVTFLAELPRTPTGKILKRALRELP